MNDFRNDIKRLPRLLLGLVALATGIFFVRLSFLGLPPWGVFHDGLYLVSGIGFGYLTQLVGLVVLVLSMVLFRTKIGIGTVMNVAIVGPIIELWEALWPFATDTLLEQIPVFLLGMLLMTFGRSLYISSELGQGPRDGLFVGIARTTRFEVKHIKPAIELTVLIIGFILGGRFYVGTVLIVLLSGYLVQWFFNRLGFDPKQARQHSIRSYFQQKEPS